MGIQFKPASPEELAERGVVAEQPVEQAPAVQTEAEQVQTDAPAEKPAARKAKKSA